MKKNNVLIKFLLLSTFSGLCGISYSFIPSVNTPKAMAASTTLSKKSATLFVNGSYAISVKHKKKNATFTFTSNKAKIATVTKAGKITAHNSGTAKIKVRYLYKSSYKTVGTFTVTVKKPDINKKYEKVSCYTGSTFKPANYLTMYNPKASYIITSTDKTIASGNANGIITSKKAGIVTLSIHEVYNKKSRTIGHITLISSGASLKSNSIKMGYGQMLSINDVLDDVNNDNVYTLSSDNTKIVTCDSSTISSSHTPIAANTCYVTISETNQKDQLTRKIGTLKVTVTSDAYIAPEYQTVYAGLGNSIPVNSKDGIMINNPDPAATYTYTPEDKTVLDSNLKPLKYGETTITVTETKNGQTTTLDEKITVIVSKAQIKPELLKNGLSLEVEGDTYSDYPIICRNADAKYYYSVGDTSISEAQTGGSSVGQDYLVVNTKKVGKTTVTVYETHKSQSSQTIKTKIGSFTLHVLDESDEPVDVDNLTAKSIIKKLSLTHHQKVFNANICDDDLSCDFLDADGNGTIDYGINYETIDSSDFQINFKKSKYTLEDMVFNGNDSWTMVVNLHDNPDENSCTKVEIPITLDTKDDFDNSSLFSCIKVKLGAYTKMIDANTSFPDDIETKQFANSNTDFHVMFTRSQLISSGATEYNEDAVNPVCLSELKNVSCQVFPNNWSTSNQDASTTVKEISIPQTTNNSDWDFSVTFENGDIEDFTVTFDEPD